MKKICLLGASGQLGNEIQLLNKQEKFFSILPLTSKELNLIDEQAIALFFENNLFDIIINCAAYTSVDLAETQRNQSNLINNLAVKHIAEACTKNNTFLIHISTDFVFDGNTSKPLTETNKTNPLQEYGKSKLAGEQWVKNGIVIRTSWLYSSFGKNFVKTIMRLGKERSNLNVINNQFGTPTYAADLAQVILFISKDKNLRDKKGIYHYSNEGQASWFDFAVGIMNLAKISCQVNPISDTEYLTPAKRPRYSVMDKSKIKSVFKIVIPTWKTSLKKCIEIIENNGNRNK